MSEEREGYFVHLPDSENTASKTVYTGDNWMTATKRVYMAGMIAEIVLKAASLPWEERVRLYTQVSEILTDREVAVFCLASHQGETETMRSIGENVARLWRQTYAKGTVL